MLYAFLLYCYISTKLPVHLFATMKSPDPDQIRILKLPPTSWPIYTTIHTSNFAQFLEYTIILRTIFTIYWERRNLGWHALYLKIITENQGIEPACLPVVLSYNAYPPPPCVFHPFLSALHYSTPHHPTILCSNLPTVPSHYQPYPQCLLYLT